MTQGRDRSRSTVDVARAYSKVFVRKHTAFSLTVGKAHREHLAVVDAAPFIKNRLQHAVSFPPPRMGEHKQEQNLLLGKPHNPEGRICTEFLAVISIQPAKPGGGGPISQ